MSESAQQDQKQEQWQQAIKQSSRTIDKLGRPVDGGILETVAVFNLLDIRTTASCEGHLDHGTYAPWVDIGAEEGPNERDKERAAFEEARRQSELNTLSEEDIRRLFAQARELQRQNARKHIELQSKALAYLTAFYEKRHVPYDQQLIIQGSYFRARIESQGATIQQILSPEERAEKLLVYQQEMQTFTQFLKNIWFAQP